MAGPLRMAGPRTDSLPSHSPGEPTHLEVQVCDPAVVKVSDGLQHLPQVRPDLPFGEVSPSDHAVQETPLVSPAEAGSGVTVSTGLVYSGDLSGLMRNKCSISVPAAISDSFSRQLRAPLGQEVTSCEHHRADARGAQGSSTRRGTWRLPPVVPTQTLPPGGGSNVGLC